MSTGLPLELIKILYASCQRTAHRVRSQSESGDRFEPRPDWWAALVTPLWEAAEKALAYGLVPPPMPAALSNKAETLQAVEVMHKWLMTMQQPADLAVHSGHDTSPDTTQGRRIAALLDRATRHYASASGAVWLAAFPAGVRVGRCEEHDDKCGVISDGCVSLPWGCLQSLGAVDVENEGGYTVVSFSPLYRKRDEWEQFTAFAADAGAALVADPPFWGQSQGCGSPVAAWAGSLLFIAPATKDHVVIRPGGCRLITQPWGASIAALRQWQCPVPSDRLASGQLPEPVLPSPPRPTDGTHTEYAGVFQGAADAVTAGVLGMDYWYRKLEGRDSTSALIHEYLVVQHGMTCSEVNGMTPVEIVEILKADYERVHSPINSEFEPAAETPASPTKPTDRETQAIAALLTIGPNATKIAEAIGVPRTTLLGWCRFRALYDKLKDQAQSEKEHRRRSGYKSRDGSFDVSDEAQ